MLWYKAWLDTRWRFLIGLALLVVAACGIVYSYLQVHELLRAFETPPLANGSGPGQRILADMENYRTYEGYVWSQWFDQNFSMLSTLCAALLGSGSALSGSGRGLLFSLALPVSRRSWVGARAALGIAQLLVLTIVPSLAIVLLSPVIGQTYAAGDALVHGFCMFVGASVFFGVAALLSTVFNDVWRPLLLTCALAFAIGIGELVLPSQYGLFDVMSAATYFRGGSLPWLGVIVSAAATAGLLYAAAANVERRDF
jgi:hypothetical protein